MITTKEQNGGYYAIKGFTYQFDKSLLEALANKDKSIEIEQIQDIGVEGYYIQVKYKETQKYSESKIRPAVIQLLRYFIADKNRKFNLYCHFKDKSSQKTNLDLSALDSILGIEKDSFTDDDKKSFLMHFTLEFSENFEGQFKKLLSEIKMGFSLKSEEEAAVHHAILRSQLFDVAIRKRSSDRAINFQTLKDLLLSNEKIIFEFAHYKYLKNEKYLTYLKKEYFTFRGVNMPKKERLFIIEVDPNIKDVDLIQIISNIKGRYFKKNTSPCPYICLVGVEIDRLVSIKQKLWDQSLHFNDGTHFDKDKFRISDLIADTPTFSTISFKLINKEDLPRLFKHKDIDEIYAFLINGDGEWRKEISNIKEFFVAHTKDIIKIIQ